MKSHFFSEKSPGRLVPTIEGAMAFVPDKLTKLNLSAEQRRTTLVQQASLALGKLDGTAKLLPSPEFLIGPLSYREALLTSKIEGTVTTAEAVLLAEASPSETSEKSEIDEVRNYLRAMDSAIKSLENLPLSNRLICDAHRILMRGVRGDSMTPGEFRRIQNYIGTPRSRIASATYVPPPPQEVPTAMQDLEVFLNDHNSSFDPLTRLAVAHYQFEAIHPFLDGNGRIGRLLITLSLCAWGVMSRPLLYSSTFFSENETDYRGLLQQVTQSGKWSEWIEFFLLGIRQSADDALSRAEELVVLRESLYRDIRDNKRSILLLDQIDRIMAQPWTTASKTAQELGVSLPTANKVIDQLRKIGFLIEATGRQKRRIYIAPAIREIIERDARF